MKVKSKTDILIFLIATNCSLFQDKYVLSGFVFLCAIALENAVAAVISDKDVQKAFDRYWFYIALGAFVLIHLIGIVVIVMKVNLF